VAHRTVRSRTLAWLELMAELWTRAAVALTAHSILSEQTQLLAQPPLGRPAGYGVIESIPTEVRVERITYVAHRDAHGLVGYLPEDLDIISRYALSP
jgi:hypothetical protein